MLDCLFNTIIMKKVFETIIETLFNYVKLCLTSSPGYLSAIQINEAF